MTFRISHGSSSVGYNPTIVPAWTSPTCEAFAGLRLEPWRFRVFPGTVLTRQGGQVLKWREPEYEGGLYTLMTRVTQTSDSPVYLSII